MDHESGRGSTSWAPRDVRGRRTANSPSAMPATRLPSPVRPGAWTSEVGTGWFSAAEGCPIRIFRDFSLEKNQSQVFVWPLGGPKIDERWSKWEKQLWTCCPGGYGRK